MLKRPAHSWCYLAPWLMQAADQFQDRVGKRPAALPVAGYGRSSAGRGAEGAAEMIRRASAELRRLDAVGLALQRDGRHRDLGLRGKARFDLLQRRIARRIAEAVAIGMDCHRDEIRIVEASLRSARKSRRRTANTATTVPIADGRTRGGRRRARRGRARCENNIGTRSGVPARAPPASPRRECFGCCSRCR